MIRRTIYCLMLMLSAQSISAIAATTDLVGSSSWSALLIGSNFDSYTDTQASKAGTEIVGNVLICT